MRALWTRDYAGIAERAHLRETAGDPVKLAALIHERTRPFYGEPELVGINARIDHVLGKIMGKALPIDLRVGP